MGTTSATTSAHCGSGWELTGGGATVSGTPPGTFIGGTRAQTKTSWFGIGWHIGAPKKKVSAYGVCSQKHVIDDKSVGPIGAAVASASHAVDCPHGQVVGGGVVGIGGDHDFFINSSYPLDTDADGEPDDAWNAWLAHADGDATSMRTGVQCLRHADLRYRDKTRNVDSGANVTVTAACRSGHVSGGGAFVTGDATQAHVVSTRPIDDGDRDSVPDDAWEATVSNPIGAAKVATTYVICLR
jgi:hypothetical protein